jgi:F-box protein 21
MTSDFQRDTPTFGQLTTRDKALALVAWLRSHRFVGLNGPDETYSNLRNRLLGQALLRNEHCSIPIISAVIYSSIAKRLGLNAAPVCFPGHVRVVVNRTMGQDLDGNTLRVGEIGWSERMFLDPFGSDEELSQREVRSIMRLYNIFDYPGTHGYAWLAAQPAELVQRNAYNILDTCHQFARHAADPETQNLHPLADLGYGDPETHVMAAVHASLWAFVLSTPVDDPLWRNHNRKFLGNIMNNWREDAWLLERYAPRVDDDHSYLDPHERTDVESVTEVLRFIRSLDSRRPTVHRRYAEEVTRNVKYRVGQVFRHTRYGSMGVIVGWDPDGTATISAGSQATQAFAPRHLFAAGSEQGWDQFRRSRGVFYQVM